MTYRYATVATARLLWDRLSYWNNDFFRVCEIASVEDPAYKRFAGWLNLMKIQHEKAWFTRTTSKVYETARVLRELEAFIHCNEHKVKKETSENDY